MIEKKRKRERKKQIERERERERESWRIELERIGDLMKEEVDERVLFRKRENGTERKSGKER